MNSPALLALALACYVAGGLLAGLARRMGRGPATAGVASSVVGVALQVAFLLGRWRATGFLPFASRFESMALFALAVQLTGLVVYLAAHRHSAKAASDVLAALLLGGALAPVGFHPGGGLNPILNSPWFAGHILVSFAGYACILVGLGWSVARLFDGRLEDSPGVPRRLALGAALLLGTGILTGSAWADSSWGIYWSWDPKESWALFTWTLLVAGIHLVPRTGRRWVSVLFFGLATGAMLFTFVGINLLRWGLHRYQGGP